jgi:transcriptional regulator with XRE-family HTH domain
VDIRRFGRAIRAIRVRRGWRQADLATRAGVARSVSGRLERGERRGLTLDTVGAVADALGARADLRLAWEGAELDRLLDEAHARLVELTVRMLRGLGWDVAVEVTFSRFGERGSIDVLAFHPGRRVLLVVEVKSVIPDMQALLDGVDRKGRLAPEVALVRGWNAGRVARVLVVWDTRTNRRRVAAHAASVAAQLPFRTREVVAWLRDPMGAGVSGVLFVSDVHRADATSLPRHRVRRPRA